MEVSVSFVYTLLLYQYLHCGPVIVTMSLHTDIIIYFWVFSSSNVEQLLE